METIGVQRVAIHRTAKIVRIGEKALTFRFPVVSDGDMAYVDPETFMGRWLILSFVSTLRTSDSLLWNHQGKELAALGAALLVVPSETKALYRKRSLRLGHIHFTVVGDPLSRLQRLYGGTTAQSFGRGRTFLIDPSGSLRFHLVHSLTGEGMKVLTEALRAYQDMEHEETQRRRDIAGRWHHPREFLLQPSRDNS